MNQHTIPEIFETLIEYRQRFDPAELFPTVVPEAAHIVVSDPYAFSIATCLDRGTKAEIIWTIPYDMKNTLGHLDPMRIYRMTMDQLTGLFARLPRRPRYVNDAPRTLYELTRIVVDECACDAARIWQSKCASEVKRTFMSIHGVGPGIASMAVLLIESAFNIYFNDLDHTQMDIKPDVHTKRVLYRLGVSLAETEQAAIQAARKLSPAYPGAIDGALWLVGREFCHSERPHCRVCPLTRVCQKKLN